MHPKHFRYLITFISFFALFSTQFGVWYLSLEKKDTVEESVTIIVPQKAYPNYLKYCGTLPLEGLNQSLIQSAEEFELDPKILALTIYRESSCRTQALGASGEIGLTQINPKVWVSTLKSKGLIKTERDLWNPQINIRSAAYILASHKKTSSVYQTFRKYNGSGTKAELYAKEQTALYEKITF